MPGTIESLSSFQKYLINIYKEMWAERMLRTERVTQGAAEFFSMYLYTNILGKPPVLTFIAPSPAAAQSLVMQRARPGFSVVPETEFFRESHFESFPKLGEIQNCCAGFAKHKLNTRFFNLYNKTIRVNMTEQLYSEFADNWRSNSDGRYFPLVERIANACAVGGNTVYAAPQYPHILGYMVYCY